MATEIKLRRGTTAQHTTNKGDGSPFTGAEGEVTYDQELKTLRVHDNSTAGGIVLAKKSDVEAEDTLAEMNDVNLTSPADGSLLKYDNASSKWIDSSNLTETATGIDVTGSVSADGVTLGDDEKIQLGDAQDLELFHDGTNSYVQDVGDGSLILNTTNGGGVFVQSAGETMATFNSNGAANLYYDNSAKLSTADTGINVTGTVTASDGLTADYIDLTGGESTTTTGTVACSKIKLADPSTPQNDEHLIYTEADSVGSPLTNLVIHAGDDTHEKVILRVGNNNGGHIDALKATGSGVDIASSLDVTGTVTASSLDVTGTVTAGSSISIASDADTTDPQPDLNFYNNEDDAVGQRIGQFNWFGKNNLSPAGQADIKYAWQELRTINVTDGEESAQHETWVKNGAGGHTRVLQVQPTGIDVTGTVTCDEALTISSDGSGADAKPDIFLYNNATAADGERLGQITYYGKNSATETTNYGWHEVKTVDVTDGVEDSVMEFWVRNGAGNHNKSLTLNKGGIDVAGTVEADAFSGTGTTAITDFITDVSTSNNDTTVPTTAAVKSYVDANAGTTYTIGTGLTLNGTTVNVDAAQTHITSVGTLTSLTTGDTTINGNLEVKSTTAGTYGADSNFLPEIRLKRDGGAPAGEDGDVLGALVFEGDNRTGVQKDYARIGVTIKDDGTGVTDGRVKGEIRFACADGTASPTLEQPSCSIDSTGVHINSYTNDGVSNANYYHVDNINLAGVESGGLKFNSRIKSDAANKTTTIFSKDITEDHEISVPNVSGSLVVAAIAGGSINGGGGTSSPKSTWSESDFSANPNSMYLHYNSDNTNDLTVSPDYPSDSFGDSFKFLNASPLASDIIIDLDGYAGSSVAVYALVKTDGSLNATINTASHTTITVSSGGFVTLTKVSFSVYLVEGIGYTYA